MLKIFKIFIVFLSIYAIACKEEYFPEFDHAEKILVINGILSDESNEINVTVSNAMPFKEQAYLPESQASVIVADDLGREFKLKETNPGQYELDPFNYEYGRTYTLVVGLKNNRFYRSSPQKLFPKSTLDTISATYAVKTLQTTLNNNLILQKLPGLEFSVRLDNTADESPYYFFSNKVLLEFNERHVWFHAPDSLPFLYNSWKKYFPNQFFNLNEHEPTGTNKYRHSLTFCPIDTSYFNIVMEEIWTTSPPPKLVAIYYKYIYRFVITVKKYHLNEDVYQYYKDVNRQLQSKNRIFDPISFQIKGNITSDSDPEEPVLGVFEVSSCDMRSYTFTNFMGDKKYEYEEIEPLDIDKLPKTGIMYNEYPPFWIFK